MVDQRARLLVSRQAKTRICADEVVIRVPFDTRSSRAAVGGGQVATRQTTMAARCCNGVNGEDANPQHVRGSRSKPSSKAPRSDTRRGRAAAFQCHHWPRITSITPPQTPIGPVSTLRRRRNGLQCAPGPEPAAIRGVLQGWAPLLRRPARMALSRAPLRRNCGCGSQRPRLATTARFSFRRALFLSRRDTCKIELQGGVHCRDAWRCRLRTPAPCGWAAGCRAHTATYVLRYLAGGQDLDRMQVAAAIARACVLQDVAKRAG
ncbi:hypothetical protein BDY21DRAFT_333526 [Lineolata rhizophorae]|uniref:Uncharacterized protein n=1 Tax=Lineolata rhizophorae TaxID=578093 RepID=A0A6A6PBM9_9PEZI|nr:hypothetical protein BDY21DRAFT_333526 [Lineolata rhizophorae]